MANAKRVMKWLMITSAFAACAWFGVQGVVGAANVAVFYVWFALVVSLLAQADSMLQATAERLATSPIPRWLDRGVDFALVCWFVWHGWWITGVAYLLHVLLMAAVKGKAVEAMEKRAADQGAKE